MVKKKSGMSNLFVQRNIWGKSAPVKTISENLTENEAKQLGEELAKQYNVELQKWGRNNE